MPQGITYNLLIYVIALCDYLKHEYYTSHISSFITVELSRCSVARTLPFRKVRDMRHGRLQ